METGGELKALTTAQWYCPAALGQMLANSAKEKAMQHAATAEMTKPQTKTVGPPARRTWYSEEMVASHCVL